MDQNSQHINLRDKHQGTERRVGCKVSRLMNVMGKDNAEWLSEVLESNHSTTSILETLTDGTPYEMSYSTLTRHRDKTCPCYREGKISV